MSALVEHRGAPLRSPRFRALVAVADPDLRRDVITGLVALGAAEVIEAASAAEARARTRAGGPGDLLVVHAALPDGSGLALFDELRQIGWQRGLVLAESNDVFTVRGALAHGVRSFIVTPRPSGADAPRPDYSGGHGVEQLSAREVEVLELVAAGRSNKDIGADLHLSALTVKSHLARIGRKLGTGDRAAMVAMAMRAGVVR